MNFDYLFRRYTASYRLLPNFLIVGTQKGGTTSLYHYLTQHDNIDKSPIKEINYFNLLNSQHINEYKHYFPLRINTLFNSKLICGEATPDYIIYPQIPKLIKETIPNVKIIMLLRNPVDRLFSHYSHNLMMNREWLTLNEAIDFEDKRIGKNKINIFTNKNDMIKNYSNYSYINKGLYYEQISYFKECFEDDKLLILQSEKLFKNPLEITNLCLQFLNLSKLDKIEAEPQNTRKVKIDIDKKLYQRLKEFYNPHNEKLYKMINQRFDW